MNLVGTKIGSIVLDRLLGAGGMGEVYRGFDQKLERYVAVKTIRAEDRLSPELKARFLREARILSKLGHPGICQIYDLVENDQNDFLVLELVEGRTLAECVRARMSYAQTLQIALAIDDALVAAHRERIVHRDLKPENIMVGADGSVKILDFGIARSLADDNDAESLPDTAVPEADDAQASRVAEPDALTELWAAPVTPRSASTRSISTGERLTRQGRVLGTRRYMSPEQAAGQKIGAASDIYSFGVLLEEALVSSPGGIPGGDCALLLAQMQSVEPDRRPTAVTVGERLRWLLDAPQRARRQRVRARLFTAAGVVLIVLLGLVSKLAIDARNARIEAVQRRVQAEGLIQFMLGDLREKLTRVGKLELLSDINRRALDYFNAIPADSLSLADALARLHSYEQIAEVSMQSGELSKAEAPLRDALTLAQSLRQKHPENPDVAAEVAEALSWLAYLMYERDQDYPAASALFRQALVEYHELWAREPNDMKRLAALASANSNLGSMAFGSRQFVAARGYLQEAVRLLARQLARAPDDNDARGKLAAAQGWLSSTLLALGELRDARSVREQQVDNLRKVFSAQTENRLAQDDLGVALFYQAAVQGLLGDTAARAKSLAEAEQVDVELATLDAHNAGWQRQLAVLRNALADAAIERGDAAATQRELDAAAQIWQALLEKDAGNRSWRVSRAVHSQTQARLRLSEQRADEALALLQTAHAELAELNRAQPSDYELVPRLAENDLLQAQALRMRGDGPQVEARLREGDEHLQPLLPSSQDPHLLGLAAKLALERDQAPVARAWLERLVAMGYVDPGLDILCRRRDADCAAVVVSQ